jgi:hypothetical protein
VERDLNLELKADLDLELKAELDLELLTAELDLNLELKHGAYYNRILRGFSTLLGI